MSSTAERTIVDESLGNVPMYLFHFGDVPDDEVAEETETDLQSEAPKLPEAAPTSGTATGGAPAAPPSTPPSTPPPRPPPVAVEGAVDGTAQSTNTPQGATMVPALTEAQPWYACIMSPGACFYPDLSSVE